MEELKKAYVLCYISENNKVRLLEISNNMRKIIEMHIGELKTQLENGATVYRTNIKDGKVYVYGKILYDTHSEMSIPKIKRENSISKFKTVIGQVYNKDGEHSVITLDCKGNAKIVSLEEVIENVNDYTNIDVFRTTKEDKELPMIKNKHVENEYDLIIYKDILRLVDTKNLPEPALNSQGLYKIESQLLSKEEYIAESFKFKGYNNGRFQSFVYRDIDNRGIIRLPYNEQYGILGISTNKVGKLEVFVPRNIISISRENYASTKLNNQLNIEFIFENDEVYERKEGIVISGFDEYFKEHNIDALELIPDTVEEINSYKCSKPSTLSRFKNLKIIKNSFTDCIISEEEIVIPEGVEVINSSFKTVIMNVDKCKIILPSTLKNISSSFNEMIQADGKLGLVEFDFSKCSQLEYFEQSLFNIHCKEIDLSKTSIKEVGNSIAKIPELEKVELPKSITTIYGWSVQALSELPNIKELEIPEGINNIGTTFKGCSIEYLRIPGSATHIFIDGSVPTIEFSDREDLKGSTISCTISSSNMDKRTKIIFNNIGCIRNGGFTFSSKCEVELHGKINKISNGAFYGCELEVLDLYNINITDITYECFARARSKAIILPKNTKKVDEKAFIDSLPSRIFIPKTLSNLNRNTIKNSTISSGTCKIFVEKGTEIAKICNNLRLNVVECETEEEAVSLARGDNLKSSELAQKKAKMFGKLGDDKIIKELLLPQYIDTVQKQNEIYSTFLNSKRNGKIPFNGKNTKKLFTIYQLADILEKNRTRDLPYLDSDKAKLDKCIERLRISNTTPVYGPDSLSNEFKLLSNIITNIIPTDEYIQNLDNLDKLINYIRYSKCSLVYSDDCSTVISMILASNPDIMNLNESSQGQLWIVTIGKNVIYIGLELLNKPEKFSKRSILNKIEDLIIDREERPEQLERNLDTVINIGDVINNRNSSKIELSGVYLAPKLNWMMINYIQLNLIELCNKEMPNDKESSILLNLGTGTIYRTLQNRIPDGAYQNNGLRDNMYIIKYKENKDNWSSETLKILKESMKDIKDLISYFKTLTSDNEKLLEELKNKNGAYDKFETSFEYEISKVLKEKNITEIKQLNFIFLSGLFNSPFFGKIRNDGYNNKEQVYGPILLTDNTELRIFKLPNNKKSNPVILGYNHNYIITLKKPDELKEHSWVSHTRFDELFEIIKNIYNPYSAEYTYIKCNGINAENFGVVYRLPFRNISKLFSYKETSITSYLCIVIGRANGGIYVAVQSADYMQPIFRFRNLWDACDFMAYCFDEVIRPFKNLNETIGIKEGIVAKLFELEHQTISAIEFKAQTEGTEEISLSDISLKYKLKESIIYRIFNNMMLGYPNNYPMFPSDKGLWDLIAKQPKQQ